MSAAERESSKSAPLVDGKLAAEEGSKPRTNSDAWAYDEYKAPEVVLGDWYSYGADWWSLGCIMYDLLHGCSPFYDVSSTRLNEKILNGKFHIRPILSVQCEDLLKRFVVFLQFSIFAID